MKPLTIDSFKCKKLEQLAQIRKVSTTSITLRFTLNTMEKLYLHLESMDLLDYLDTRIVQAQFIHYPFINCDESLEEFFESLREVIANETCRLVPRVNGKKLRPDSSQLVKSSKHGRNVYTKIYTKTSGRVKCKVSGLVEMADESRKRVPLPLDELINESFEGYCILRLYHAYVGSTRSISLSVEEILITDRETSSSYFDNEED